MYLTGVFFYYSNLKLCVAVLKICLRDDIKKVMYYAKGLTST